MMLENLACKPQIYPADDPLSVFDISEWVEPCSPIRFTHRAEWFSAVDQPQLLYPQRTLFDRLATAWETETRNLSSVTEIAMNNNYQRIIGMGPQAIPLILERLRVSPGHWFWALGAIAGENPIPEDAAGNLRLMTDAWLQWGREHGYM